MTDGRPADPEGPRHAAPGRRPGAALVCRALDGAALAAGMATLAWSVADPLLGLSCAARHTWEVDGVLYAGGCRPLGPFLAELAGMAAAPLLAGAAWLLGPRTRARALG